jgi:hypothetical protein
METQINIIGGPLSDHPGAWGATGTEIVPLSRMQHKLLIHNYSGDEFNHVAAARLKLAKDRLQTAGV